MVLQIQVTNGLSDDKLNLISADALNQSVELKSLQNRQLREDSILLWAISNQHPGFLELLLDVVALDRDLSCSWCRFSDQTLECGRFPCTIDSQQCKALPKI